jgi:starch phosphorylase
MPHSLPEFLNTRYGCGPIEFSGGDNALFERHLVFDHIVLPEQASLRESYEAAAAAIRDILSQRWLKTQSAYKHNNAKLVYYLSMEFLIGRSLANNVINLQLDQVLSQLHHQRHIDPLALPEEEPDAGLGNGGLGRLAACFLDSMATLGLPGMGYGLRYEYGIFHQDMENGWQREQPDHWLSRADPWEIARPNEAVVVPLYCSLELREGVLRPVSGRTTKLIGIPYDRPVIGYGGRTINTLRLWAAHAPDSFDFEQFSSGDFVGALTGTLGAETITRVLYPDDSTVSGQGLRLLQEYFLVACSLADLLRRFRAVGNDWEQLPDKAAIQLNDTHPTLAVPELMRLLLDQAGLDWDRAWDLTRRTLAYTNHTLLPEALEKWPVEWFQMLLPRHLEIIYEINRQLLDQVRARYPGDDARVQRMSLIEEGQPRRVRMANLAITGSHSINGVAALHTRLLTQSLVPDFAEMFPERFNNKTNGVTQRRFLRVANPALSRLLNMVIGEGWVTDLEQLQQLKPLADDGAFQQQIWVAKREAKLRFCDWLVRNGGPSLDPDTIFDTQIKRIHEYKRQLLNALHIVVLYRRLRENPTMALPPRTFIFAGKAAPAYKLAKLIIKFINSIATTIERDPVVAERLRVVFIPDYRVTMAEKLIPASDVSEQISTAGYEASGTSNMKFMMNGALTIGTLDGANVEIAEAVGHDNLFLFGLDADQVRDSAGWYDPNWHYHNEPEIAGALDLIAADHFSHNEPGVFKPLLNALLKHGDTYRHLADLSSYANAQQRIGELYADKQAWARMAILNIAAAGRFSSDRTIAEYARDIWKVEPLNLDAATTLI